MNPNPKYYCDAGSFGVCSTPYNVLQHTITLLLLLLTTLQLHVVAFFGTNEGHLVPVFHSFDQLRKLVLMILKQLFNLSGWLLFLPWYQSFKKVVEQIEFFGIGFLCQCQGPIRVAGTVFVDIVDSSSSTLNTCEITIVFAAALSKVAVFKLLCTLPGKCFPASKMLPLAKGEQHHDEWSRM